MTVLLSLSDVFKADAERKLFMRLWIFDFDGTTATDAIDQAITRLDSACEARLRILADSPSDQDVITISHCNFGCIRIEVNHYRVDDARLDHNRSKDFQPGL
jgi:hypothetical protein